VEVRVALVVAVVARAAVEVEAASAGLVAAVAVAVEASKVAAVDPAAVRELVLASRPAVRPVLAAAVPVVDVVAVVPGADLVDLVVPAVAAVLVAGGARSGVAIKTNSNRRRSGSRRPTRRFPKVKSWSRAAARSRSTRPN
jgi:hypothetical protein